MSFYKFDTVGLMIDVSRNAVMTIDGWKRLLPLMSEMGYNAVFLYMEDVYEVEDEPFFGYMRGRYSKTELMELEALGVQYGIEMIPCIQTLSHLDQIFRWGVYKKDTRDVLLVGDERNYQLIDNMLKTLSGIFKSRRIHIGMDEAGSLGKGKYHDLNGCESESVIMAKHLTRVKKIAEKYGYQVMIWSDMLFREWNGGRYYCKKTEIPGRFRDALPKGTIPVYWDYYMPTEERYDDMLYNHKQFSDDTWFAGGIWSWLGFAPGNGFTLKTMLPAIEVCKRHGVKNIFFTLWGDYGAECSRFSLLPAMFYLSKVIRGESDPIRIKAAFKERFNIDYDDFCLLDAPNLVSHDPDNRFECDTTAKHMLYSDCLCGHLDFTVKHGGFEYYNELSERLGRLAAEGGEYAYLFDTMGRLSEILAYKYELGVKTRVAYRSKNKSELSRLVSEDYSIIIKLIPGFLSAFRKQWLSENKYCGFEVQEARIGGLLARIMGCKDRLSDYLNGAIDSIEELEWDVLPYGGHKQGYSDTFYHYLEIYTSNLTD